MMCLTCCGLMFWADLPDKDIHRMCKLKKLQVQQNLLVGELQQPLGMNVQDWQIMCHG